MFPRLSYAIEHNNPVLLTTRGGSLQVDPVANLYMPSAGAGISSFLFRPAQATYNKIRAGMGCPDLQPPEY